MAEQTIVLATRKDGFVLETFFNDYIVPWFQERVISPLTYEKARKEIGILKKRARKTTIPSTLCNNTEDEKTAVESLPDDVFPRAKPNTKPARGSSAKGSGNVSQNGTINRTANKTDVDIQAILLENAKIKKKLSETEDEMYKLSAENDVQLREKDVQLQKLRKALESTKAQVDDLTIRLSNLATDKLQDNNPDLADLSDINRPTELGRRFSEIYENEWSDAFENIAKKNESEKIRILHQVVVDAFHYSSEVFKGQVPQIRGILLQSKEGQQKVSISKNEQMIKALNGLRMQLSTETARNVGQEYSTTSLASYLSEFSIKPVDIDPTLRKYAFKCAEICWLLLMCNSRLSLSEDNVDVTFDVETYNPFTRRLSDIDQPTVDFCVWPALCQDCGVLVKGVAQPKGRKRKPLDLQR